MSMANDTRAGGMARASVESARMEHLTDIRVGPAGAHVGAFFDLDGTLVEGFTAAAHLRHRIRHRQARFGELTGTVEAALRYRFGRMRFEQLLLRAGGYLRGESLAELQEVGEHLFERYIRSRVYDDMSAIVRAHQEAGHTLVISSSAMTMHAAPIARALGIAHVICNQFDVDENGRLTGSIVRPIIWGARKAEAVIQFCAANGIDLQHSYFYADGAEDLPLMRVVGNPRPVNPRRGLAAAAAERRWPVLRLEPACRRSGISMDT
jgi:HAD superfamily hydrolase (TIGR01490 family)